MNNLRTVLACLALLASGASASADQILFSNLGPGGTYDPHRATFFGFGEEQTDPQDNFSRAFPFVASATATLTTIEMPLEFPWFAHPWFDGGTLEVNLFESSGGLPVRVIDSFTSAGPFTPEALTVFRSVVQPQLTAGLMYFLEARAIGEANGLWYSTPTNDGVRALDYWRQGDGPWQVGGRLFEAAFSVSGDVNPAPTPEPTSVVLLGSGLALAAWRRRRSRSPILGDANQ